PFSVRYAILISRKKSVSSLTRGRARIPAWASHLEAYSLKSRFSIKKPLSLPSMRAGTSTEDKVSRNASSEFTLFISAQAPKTPGVRLLLRFLRQRVKWLFGKTDPCPPPKSFPRQQ